MNPLQSNWKYERTSFYAETVVDNTTRNWRHEDMDDMKNTNLMENREWTQVLPKSIWGRDCD